jgi:branched-chain amino acid transport system ATP-binding protein
VGVILSLENVSKSYGALRVTDGVSFDVAEGEALGIIGPNGAGKSTLFNLITGNVLPEKGKITLLGRDVTRVSPMERCLMGVGRSFQIPQPFGNLTVFENLVVAATHGSRRPSERAVTALCAEVLERTELLSARERAGGGR